MSIFDSREKALEDFFIHKMENEIKRKAKSYRTFDEWAAAELSSEKADAEEYVKSLTLYELDFHHDQTALNNVTADFKKAGLYFTKFDLQDKFYEFYNALSRSV